MQWRSDMNERAFGKSFKAFADRTRLKILVLLSSGEMTVNEITASVGLSQPTVSRHLAILREAEIVADRRAGQQVFYSLEKSKVKACCLSFCDCLDIDRQSPSNSKT